MRYKTLRLIICLVLFCGMAAQARAAYYLSAINADGTDSPTTMSSGTLPGVNPAIQMAAPRRLPGGAPFLPVRLEPNLPQPAPFLLKAALSAFQQKQQSLSGLALKTYIPGEQKSFWVKDASDPAWRQVAATCAKESDHSYIFVDDGLTVADASLQLYAVEFDTMYDLLADNIGTFSDRDGNGKVAILIYGINDGGTISGYYAGYFWGKDYVSEAQAQTQGIHSNEMDMIYIRGNLPGGWDTNVHGDFYTYNLTTLVHEYQHMVQFSILAWQTGTGMTADTWINEMMSLASETMYFKAKLAANPSFTHPDMLPDGYLASRVDYYNNDYSSTIRNGHGLTYWDYTGDVLANYALSYLMGQYLALHSSQGQGIFKDILTYMRRWGIYDYRAVAAKASRQIPGIRSWEGLLENWAAANILNLPSGLAGYSGAFTLTPQGPTSNPVQIHNGGMVYREIDEVAAPADADPYLTFYAFTVADQTCADPVATVACTNTNGCCPADLPFCWSDATCRSAKEPRQRRCAATQLLGEGNPGLAALYGLRDRIFSRTEAGRRLASLYYRHTEEVSRLLTRHPGLKARVRGLLFQALPELYGIASGEAPSVTQPLIDLCAAVLGDLGHRGSPALRQDCDAVIEGLKNGSLLVQLGMAVER